MPTWRASLDAMLTFAEQACVPARAVRSPTWSTSAYGGSDLGPAMVVQALQAFGNRACVCTSSPTWTATTSPGAEELGPPPHAVHCRNPRPSRRRDAGERTDRQGLVPGGRRHGRGAPFRGHQQQHHGGGGLRHRHRLRLGLGRWPLFAVVGHRRRSPSPSGPTTSVALLAGAHAMDEHFAAAPLGAICRCCWP